MSSVTMSPTVVHPMMFTYKKTGGALWGKKGLDGSGDERGRATARTDGRTDGAIPNKDHHHPLPKPPPSPKPKLKRTLKMSSSVTGVLSSSPAAAPCIRRLRIAESDAAAYRPPWGFVVFCWFVCGGYVWSVGRSVWCLCAWWWWFGGWWCHLAVCPRIHSTDPQYTNPSTQPVPGSGAGPARRAGLRSHRARRPGAWRARWPGP